MTKFISNVNQYLSEMKIKQMYLSMVTGIDKKKLSRLLAGSQEESGTDMEKIATGLGKIIAYMAVLICCFELELIDGNAVPDHMFKFDRS